MYHSETGEVSELVSIRTKNVPLKDWIYRQPERSLCQNRKGPYLQLLPSLYEKNQELAFPSVFALNQLNVRHSL